MSIAVGEYSSHGIIVSDVIGSGSDFLFLISWRSLAAMSGGIMKSKKLVTRVLFLKLSTLEKCCCASASQ